MGERNAASYPNRRRQLAHLFLALAEGDGSTDGRVVARQAEALRALGVVKGGKTDDQIEATLARDMFDSSSAP